MSDVQRIKHFDMTDTVEKATKLWLEQAGIAVTRQAKELAPVDTGRLRTSINYR